MLAAIMVAANLGSRVTGWGFAVFALGSLGWAIVGLTNGQAGLALTNGFLLAINAFGVWRWLGRQARYEKGGLSAARRSRRAATPTLFSAELTIGAPVLGPGGERLGGIIDAMFNCESRQLAYIVISQGGIGGAGEILRAIPAAYLRFTHESVRCTLWQHEIALLPDIGEDDWPAAAPTLPIRAGQ